MYLALVLLGFLHGLVFLPVSPPLLFFHFFSFSVSWRVKWNNVESQAVSLVPKQKHWPNVLFRWCWAWSVHRQDVYELRSKMSDPRFHLSHNWWSFSQFITPFVESFNTIYVWYRNCMYNQSKGLKGGKKRIVVPIPSHPNPTCKGLFRKGKEEESNRKMILGAVVVVVVDIIR